VAGDVRPGSLSGPHRKEMSGQPAARPESRPRRTRDRAGGPSPRADYDRGVRARALERRRRERHYRLRRRDLLQDTVIAVLLAVVMLTSTAGLGVVAILLFATGAALIAMSVAERTIRRRARIRARGRGRSGGVARGRRAGQARD
jgi:hypothetical protein